jgi:hypothetical protein
MYFRIVAVDTQRIEVGENQLDLLSSPSSDIYGIGYGSDTTVLIVDAFDRRASWSAPQHSFVKSHGDAVTAAGIGWETAVNDAVQAGEVRLEDYTAVIYICGDESDFDESLSRVEQSRIESYLKSGGKLFISGSELAYDLCRAGRPDRYWFNFVLRSQFIGDDSGIRSCIGADGTVFSGLALDFGAVTSDTYLEDYPDHIVPYENSTPVLYYTGSTRIAGITYTGNFGGTGPDGQLVYMSFPFETIYPASSRVDVMGRILQDLRVATPVHDPGMQHPHGYTLSQNYPNPFNPTTTLEFQTPMRTVVTISVYDVLGRRVEVLLNEMREAGTHRIVWNASGMPSGVYFYRLEIGGGSTPINVLERKMVVIK